MDSWVVRRIEWVGRERKWSAARLEFELALEGVVIAALMASLAARKGSGAW